MKTTHAAAPANNSSPIAASQPTRDDSDSGSIWMWLCLIIVILAVLALSAFYYWCEQQKLALIYPPYPLRCDEALRASDAGDGVEAATRVPAAPQVTIPPIVVSPVGIPRAVADPSTQGENYDQQHVDRAAIQDIAEVDGSLWARGIRAGIPLTPGEMLAVPGRFIALNETDGVLGFHRLGLTHLGKEAFDIAKLSGLYVPFCPGAGFVHQDPVLSYTYFTLIRAECSGVTNPPEDVMAWLEEIRTRHPNLAREFSRIDRTSDQILTDLMQTHSPDLDPEDPIDRLEFCRGVPKAGTTTTLSCSGATTARQALKLGDALQASGRTDRARACWLAATKLAQTDPEGADAGMIAQRRLQAATSTCKPTEEGLARISRDYKARTGDLIRVMVLKHALKALRHYDGPLDDRLSEETRAAIARFQAEREEDQTGTLTPEQTTMLICSAAESTRDVVAETTLGVMYTIGLGVAQNIDQAHEWLTEASSRKHPDATYNLAILYGTGIILNSYRLCDVPRSPEQADRYLQEAAYQGHPEAQRLYAEFGPGSRYAGLTPRERWAVIEMQLEQRRTSNALYSGKLSLIGTKCAPDRSVR